ncbi:ATP-binding protein [Ancylothrix sp. C2]|uniref:ATP-binding protein n=1 Tax=Ancylothrix sp. D3o TaxID=2953691 RepID=UPI0021BBAD3A|nr:ATP-binding protein [Ancylothrix sp. D3o]MCT7949460.1 ATP-binding protein [Ancylothrix sp. D3o]
MASLHPHISYTHSLSELSVNKKDPCEVIRELISNSYDARANRIEIYPLLKEKGFIYFDNGIGLSETQEINGITPYEAFFSIGMSTKIQGEAIGYKCQGSKLCFASTKFTLITRCKGEENWRSISIDNPKKNLKVEFDISSQKNEQPWESLAALFKIKNSQIQPILDKLNQEYFRDKFNTGAMIIVEGLEVNNFPDYYDSKKHKDEELSYLRNYIRFYTRHGDMRILRPNDTGFPNDKQELFKSCTGYNDQCKLYLWTENKLKKIEVGYPYLEKPDDSDKLTIKSPANVAKLIDGRFYERLATNFEFEGMTYCLVLAIDGNRRAMDKYSQLSRKGKKQSCGIKLTDQRGTFICVEGVKICSFNEIFEQSQLDDYAVLATPAGQCHYTFMINGTFDVVTNRNSLTDASLNVLRNPSFVDEIKYFFDKAMNKEVFKELIERLNKENQEVKLDTYTKKLNNLKKGIKHRPRFMVDIESFKDRWIVEPKMGEEHWVGALYTMFAHLVPNDSPYADIWLRPRTFSSMGIDSIAVDNAEKSLDENVHKALEYKYAFYPSDEFNHPLILTSQIICWEMPAGENNEQIEDSYEYSGSIVFTEQLDGIGYEIQNIENDTNGDVHGGKIKVISLKKLLQKTFPNSTWKSAPAVSKKKGTT